ncbi:MAG TPA: ABC transporter permease [Candidatus Limnocylindrales bacterium]|nr:ABC transporter permease [Candidatus Limnocylindrales bacterium]HEU4919627.1 ABC transporter permease [Candidatus Limnocylindrales bacterium]
MSARSVFRLILVPAVSIILALLLGSVLILASSLIIDEAINFALPLVAYESLIEGSLGFSFLDVEDEVVSFALSVDPERAERALTSTVVAAAPLVMTGLAVGVGFKAGLFNIGGTGQVLVGGFAAALVGASVAGQPAPIAVTIAVAAGALGGAVYGFIPGALKAFTGAHEVVSTIMLNSLASFAIVGLVNDILKITGPSFARTADVGNAALPVLFGRNGHLGVLLALAVVPLAYVLIYRTTLGFEIRTVGANPTAARYAGMSPRWLIVLTMSLCGMFAGLGGTLEILSPNLGYYPAIFGTSIGFAGITVALLGRAHPVGILLAALLFGAMRAGAPAMQITAKVPVEIIEVIQGLILLFLAAEVVIRRLLRIKADRVAPDELKTVAKSYGEGTV